MKDWIKEFKDLSYKHIVAERDVKPFLILVFMLFTFVMARLYIYVVGEAGSLILFKYHIHHFYYGVIFLTVAALIAIMLDGEEIKRISASFVGIGLGLILDEVGILLTCGTRSVEACDPLTVYWSRLSYDIVIYGLLLYLALMFFIPVWYRNHERIMKIWYKILR